MVGHDRCPHRHRRGGGCDEPHGLSEVVAAEVVTGDGGFALQDSGSEVGGLVDAAIDAPYDPAFNLVVGVPETITQTADNYGAEFEAVHAAARARYEVPQWTERLTTAAQGKAATTLHAAVVRDLSDLQTDGVGLTTTSAVVVTSSTNGVAALPPTVSFRHVSRPNVSVHQLRTPYKPGRRYALFLIERTDSDGSTFLEVLTRRGDEIYGFGIERIDSSDSSPMFGFPGGPFALSQSDFLSLPSTIASAMANTTE